MSPLDWIRWCREAPVAGAPKAVLWAMASRANQHGRLWPSEATIAADAGLSDRTVRRALVSLEADGWLTVERRPGRAAVYLLDAGRLWSPALWTPDTVSTPSERPRTLCPTHPGQSDRGTPDRASGGSDTVSYPLDTVSYEDPMKQPLKQPRQEPEEAATLLSAKADAAVSPAKAARDAAWDRCVALWRNVSKGAGKLTRSRGLGRDLVAAIRRDGPDVTVLRFRWVVESDHHRAVFLRERGEMKTLLRLGNVGQYDLWAAEWAEGGYRSQATPSPKRAKSAPMSFREAYALHGMYGDRRHERDDDPNTITVLPE